MRSHEQSAGGPRSGGPPMSGSVRDDDGAFPGPLEDLEALLARRAPSRPARPGRMHPGFAVLLAFVASLAMWTMILFLLLG